MGFKDMKLAMKIGGGFILVLALTVIITALSVFSLRSLQATSHKNDVTSLIVQQMQSGTVAGKNFVITKDVAYRGEVDKAMDDIIQETTKLRDIEKDKKHIELFNAIIAGASTYRGNFGEYGKYEDQKKGVEKQLTEKEAALVTLISGLYDAQLKDFSNLIRTGAGSARLADKAEKRDIAQQLMIHLYEARFSISAYLLYKDASSVEAAKKSIDMLVADITDMRASFAQKKNRDVADSIIDTATKYRALAETYVTLNAVQEEYRKKAADGGALTIKNATEVSDAAAAEMTRLMALTIGSVLLGAIVAILIGIAMAVIITRAITGAMKKGVDFALKIAEGDLTARLDIDQKDEIGMLASALQNMLERLTGIVEEVTSAALQVSSGSQQLSSTAQQMSQGATEQASSVEEISSSMEEMSSNIKQNADNSMQTEKIAQKSAQSAEAGGKAVAATVEAMKEIASKIGIIEEIARSTNMLALNASIEAARAGEYGKGFAVVASEVGKLAERSQKEAGEISKLSTESVTIAVEAGETIAALIPEIKRTAELVQEISAASNEQNSGAEQINAAIMQLDKVVQQNASASEESASMSEELAGQAEQMQATMKFFTVKEKAKETARVEGKMLSASVAKPTAPTAPKATVTQPAPNLAKKSAKAPTPVAEPQPVVADKSSAGKNAAEKSSADKGPSRLPLTGIHIVLDEEVKQSGKDAIDSDFQEF